MAVVPDSMMRRVSLAELAACDIQLRPAEAVSLVIEVCRRRQAGELRGVPPPGVIRLTGDGEVVIEGPVTTGHDDVARAAHLLTCVLAGFDAVPEYRASGALRLVIARALGTLDLPAYESLADFRAALQRFTEEQAGEVARVLYLAWDRARATRELRSAEPHALTISDIRRARRATGLTLDALAAVAEVPAVQLRDLEWGYLRHWRADAAARSHLVKYARAAGLDEGLVISIAWPMIEEAQIPAPDAAAVPETTALVASRPQQLVLHRPRPTRRLAGGWIAAAVAALLIALASAAAPGPASRSSKGRVDTHLVAPAAVQISTTGTAAASVVIAPPVRRAPPRARATTRGGAASVPKRRQGRSGSFLDRELIRLVFR